MVLNFRMKKWLIWLAAVLTILAAVMIIFNFREKAPDDPRLSAAEMGAKLLTEINES